MHDGLFNLINDLDVVWRTTRFENSGGRFEHRSTIAQVRLLLRRDPDMFRITPNGSAQTRILPDPSFLAAAHRLETLPDIQ